MADGVVTYLQLTAIIWARYFLVAGLFFAALWGRPQTRVGAIRLAKRPPDAKTVFDEIRLSLVASAIYAVPGAIVILAWRNGGTAIYNDIADMGGPVFGWLYLPVSVLIYLVIHDAYFYWTHRAMHHPKLFRATHLAHHRSRQPTPWGAFAFHPWEAAISAWLLPLVAFVVPIHVGAVLALLAIMTFCSVANHAGWEIWPRRVLTSWFGRHVISAAHHNVHHTDYTANLGLYFRFWDQICGTDKGLAEPLGGKANRATKRKPATAAS